jgi:CheY-like chemotaxis protein
MPVVDGLEATLKLRTAGYKRPIIALTAHAMKEERDRCFRVGCDEHLTKPVNRQLLVKTIRRLARGRIDGKSDEATLNLWR